MIYKHLKDFMPSLRALYQKGGHFQKAATEVQALIARITTECANGDPFVGMNLTHNGENRIGKCIKSMVRTVYDSLDTGNQALEELNATQLWATV